MKKIILSIFTFYILIFYTPTMAQPTLSASSAILIETRTNTILYEKNAYTKRYPASMTKLMTALLVTQQLPDNALITKSQDSVSTVPSDSSHIGLKVGDCFSKKNALYGLLLGSDNYIAHDLAIKTSGSIQKFADSMNQKAKALGCKNTHFVNPHGYHDPNHYTTAYDMALIAKAAFNNPEIEKIAGTVSYNFYVSNMNKTIPITNSSRLLKSQTPYYNPQVVACKTGFHDDAGQTLVAKARYGDMELIAVVMQEQTPNQYLDINQLFDYAYHNFSVLKNDKYYGLSNHTVPKWVQYSAAQGIKAGWLSAGQNYNNTLHTEDLVNMLKKAGAPKKNTLTMSEVKTLTNLEQGDAMSIRQLKQIITYTAQKWHCQVPTFSSKDLSQTATFAQAVSIIQRLSTN